MSYTIRLSRSAEHELKALPSATESRVAEALRGLADTPRPRGTRKLSHGPGWRLRVGQYRVLYTVDDVHRLVTVYAIGHRRDVYRG